MRRVIFVFFLGVLCSFQGTKFYKIKVNKQISILLPSDFVPIPSEELASKFISYRAPIAAYTNMNTEVELGINRSLSYWKESDIEMMRAFYKSNIISLYDQVRFLKQEIRIINKRKYVVFEYISTINPGENSLLNEAPIVKYTYVQYCIIRDQIYVFDFTSPADQKDLWEPEAARIMESVKIK